MANLKKYNTEAERWEIFASDSASVVHSEHPALLQENETSVTVEDALIRDREDIELVKKNISWLALHGGGGSGGGGTIIEVENTIEILDAGGNPTDNIIWRSDSKSVSYQISSSKASNKFNVVITLDGVTIASPNNISQGTVNTVSIKKINAYSNNTKHTLRISAVDMYDNAVSAQCTITQISINVEPVTDTYTLNLNEVDSGSTLSVRYQVSIPGDYILYWSDTINVYNDPVNQQYGHAELTISDGFAHMLAIPYWAEGDAQKLLRTNLVSAGNTLTFYFVLVSTSDLTLKSKMLEIRSTVVSPSDLAVQPLFLSTDKYEPTAVSKASILSSNFIVYLQSDSVTYNYNITAHKVQWNENNDDWDIIETKNGYIDSGIGRYAIPNIVTYNALPSDTFFEGGNTYMLTIYAEDRINPSKRGSANSYVSIQDAGNNTIPLGVDANTIFDFNIWGASGINRNNWQWIYENNIYPFNGAQRTVRTTANMYNMGGKSDVYAEHCRLTNKAYMVINRSTIDGNNISWFPSDVNSSLSGLISSGAPQFTLSICFYNDYTPNDDRTIFNWGNYVPKTYDTVASGYGILINNHDYYIKIGNSRLITGKLQDSIYHELDIVFGENNATASGTTSVKVYHNGVLLSLDADVSIASVFAMNSFNEMSIACNKRGNTLSQYTNISLQCVSLYSVALNPFQVVCNYINHLVTYQLDNNALNTRLLNQKLNANLITPVDIDGVRTYRCALWDDSNGFDTSSWITFSGGVLSPAGGLSETCPIPIVILDFSNNADWSWTRFKQSWLNIVQPDATNVPIYFYPSGSSSSVLTNTTVTVRGQGTTSMGYSIKNLDIDFGEDRLFWAKQDWFPERIYTLKADIIDSAHANNATIGKFVNTCAENTSLVNPTPPMQYFSTHKSNFNLPTTAIDPDNGVQVRHTLEGFPVLLLVRFYSENGGMNKSLGIYSFNLGRKSYYNMGFQVLNKFRTIDGGVLPSNVNAPYLLGAPRPAEDIIDFSAQSWEGIDSINCTPKTENTEIEINAASGNDYASSMNATAPVETNGYFWSSYPNHIRHFWSNKYPGNADVTDGFQDLCRDLVRLPYQKGDFHIQRGVAYQYDWDATNNRMYVPNQTSGTLSIDRLNREPLFNITNARFYYVISMLFGLVDSLGKNLNMRIWKSTHINNLDPVWYTCFYDMDTAMGIDNAGSETVDPDVCDEELVNEPALVKKFPYGHDFGNDKMYTVHDNKLWGTLDEKTFKDQYGNEGGVGGDTNSDNSMYAYIWNLIRTNYLQDADAFLDNYFGMQTENIGELLYNQDYDVKYVNTPEAKYMYGDRKAFVKDWITKRIQFLDGYFGHMHTSNGGTNAYLLSTNIGDCSYKRNIKIVHNSGTEYVPIMSNSPCILTSTIGGITTNYYYLPANTPINVRVANIGGGPTIATQLNYSDTFLEIDDLADLAIQSFEPQISGYIDTGDVPNPHELYSTQFGSLSGFSKFDVNGNRSFKDDGIDFIKLFKTWNKGDATLPYALTELNLSNTKNTTIRSFPLNLQSDAVGPNGETYYQNPFENLTDINLTNSCVTSVVLPQNVALFTLQLANSAVEQVRLEGQAVLTNVDFTGCTALTSVTLNNCSAFKKLTLNSLPLLSTVTVTNCSEIEEIYINVNNSTTPLHLNIDNTPKLKKISVVNAYSPDCVLVLNAENLEQLILSDCQFTHIASGIDCEPTLRYLDLSNSLVKAINWGCSELNLDEEVLDLKNCPNLLNGGVNVANNLSLSAIQLPNEENDPVPLNFSFVNCKNLERVYGNYTIGSAEVFKDCPKFTIHGGVFQNESVDSGTVQSKFIANSVTASNWLSSFQTGYNVTNLRFTTTSPIRTFYNTSCDAFDVYYALWNIGPATNISEMFAYCSKIKMGVIQSMDYSPYWTLFQNCENVTNVSNLFYNCNLGKFRIWSKNGYRSGLLSPLKRCSNFSRMFYGSEYICDRFAFRTNDGSNYANGSSINIYGFNPSVIVEDVSVLDSNGVSNAFSNPENYSCGKTTGFYDNIAGLTTGQYIFDGVDLIDYDNFASIPVGGNPFGSYRSKKAIGTIDVQHLFADKSQITSISASFTADERTANDEFATLTLLNTTFAGFNNLTTIQNSFIGGGINKLVGNDANPNFCYDILQSFRSKIQTFDLFRQARMWNGLQVDIPGTLFEGCTSLRNISNCFASFDSGINLISNGFRDCSQLTYVSNLFNSANIVSAIPNNLFNVGFTTQTVNLTGTTVETRTLVIDTTNNPTITTSENSVTVTDVVENTSRTITKYENITSYDSNTYTITYNPTSTYTETIDEWRITSGISSWYRISTISDYIASINDWNYSTIQITKKIPIARIVDISSCFAHCTLPVYIHNTIVVGGLNSEIETNPDYCPFEYVYSNGIWSKAVRNDIQETYMWVYDGSTTLSGQYYIPDASVHDITRNQRPGVNDYGSRNFCCAPDLLRWCTPTVNLTGLFNNSTSQNVIDIGPHGRIPPYLLKPVPNITSINSMFTECISLSSYNKEANGAYYLIPEDFFIYTPNITDLSYAFAEMDFLSGSTLTNFAGALRNSLNVSYIFSNCRWVGGTQGSPFTLSGVFAQNKISSAYAAFVVGTPGNLNSGGDRAQYVSFSNMFSTNTSDHNYGNDWYVFYGWEHGYVTHESSPTVSTIASRYNYTEHGV